MYSLTKKGPEIRNSRNTCQKSMLMFHGIQRGCLKQCLTRPGAWEKSPCISPLALSKHQLLMRTKNSGTSANAGRSPFAGTVKGGTLLPPLLFRDTTGGHIFLHTADADKDCPQHPSPDEPRALGTGVNAVTKQHKTRHSLYVTLHI